MAVDAREYLEEVIRIYQATYRAGLVEFDGSLGNDHIAALISIWASHKIVVSPGVTSKEEYVDKTMLPFRII